MLERMLGIDDTETLCNVCWSLAYITDDCSSGIDDVIRLGYHKRLVNLLSHPESFVKVPALRAVGNIAAGNNIQTDAVINSGAVQLLSGLTRSPLKKIRKDAVWTLSNIAAGTPQQIQSIIESGAIPNVIYLLRFDTAEIKKEALYVIYNYCFNATNEQMSFLIDPIMMNAVSDMLKSDDIVVVMIALNSIERILSGGQPYIKMFVEIDGPNRIYALSQYNNKDIFDKAKIIYNRLNHRS
jgi:hypothetical protein